MSIPKNLNIYWIAFTTLAIWFLFIHSPPILIERKVYKDVPFALHLLGAYTIYLCCMFNTLWTPSTLQGKARPYHTALGRIGLTAGILSFVFGAYCAFWPTRDLPPRGFAIGITAGGVMQIYLQYKGYVAIRNYKSLKEKIREMETAMLVHKYSSSDSEVAASSAELESLKAQKEDALREHVENMIALFCVGCSAPALIRIVGMLGNAGTWSLILTVAALILIIRPYSRTFLKPTKPIAEAETPLVSSTNGL